MTTTTENRMTGEQDAMSSRQRRELAQVRIAIDQGVVDEAAYDRMKVRFEQGETV